MSRQQAFNIAHRLLSHSLPAKLYRDADGQWHVEALKESDKWKELFLEEGEEK